MPIRNLHNIPLWPIDSYASLRIHSFIFTHSLISLSSFYCDKRTLFCKKKLVDTWTNSCEDNYRWLKYKFRRFDLIFRIINLLTTIRITRGVEIHKYEMLLVFANTLFCIRNHFIRNYTLRPKNGRKNKKFISLSSDS